MEKLELKSFTKKDRINFGLFSLVCLAILVPFSFRPDAFHSEIYRVILYLVIGLDVSSFIFSIGVASEFLKYESVNYFFYFWIQTLFFIFLAVITYTLPFKSEELLLSIVNGLSVILAVLYFLKVRADLIIESGELKKISLRELKKMVKGKKRYWYSAEAATFTRNDFFYGMRTEENLYLSPWECHYVFSNSEGEYLNQLIFPHSSCVSHTHINKFKQGETYYLLIGCSYKLPLGKVMGIHKSKWVHGKRSWEYLVFETKSGFLLAGIVDGKVQRVQILS